MRLSFIVHDDDINNMWYQHGTSANISICSVAKHSMIPLSARSLLVNMSKTLLGLFVLQLASYLYSHFGIESEIMSYSRECIVLYWTFRSYVAHAKQVRHRARKASRHEQY
jgi:hypothetical protein